MSFANTACETPVAAQEREPAQNAPAKVAVASFVGTTIEYYDFYIYGTAAALVIGPAFFPASSPAAQAMGAFLSFGLAFLARPLGSVLFGHFGDRVGRKSTLIVSLLLMGLSTVAIGLLPGYAQLGIAAPLLLCVLRFLQGLGLGGEWGGAALVAIENAPAGKRGWFGMFPQLGPSVGFLLSNGLFMALALGLDDEAFRAWGWRIPFLVSAVLVVVGLYVRVSLIEAPVFAESRTQPREEAAPFKTMLKHHKRPLLQGTLAMVACYALFYTSAIFALSYGTGTLGYSRDMFLGLLCVAVLFMAAATPLSAWASDRFGRRPVLLVGLAASVAAGFALEPWLGSGEPLLVLAVVCLFLGLMGVIFAPMGALLPELFPTRIRYTGASAAYNLAGILGASLAPYISALLAQWGGLAWVGGYVSLMALLSLIAVVTMKETRDLSLAESPRR